MYLHLLWVVFTILGLGVFGIFPATAALFLVIYKWIEKDFEIPIFKTFFSEYKKQFIRSNGLGLILVGIGVFLYIDIKISQQFIQSYPIHLLILLVSILYLIISLYFFTIFARYELSFFSYFKQTIFIAFARPIESFAMILSLIVLSYVFSLLPVLMVLAGSSILACPLVWFACRACVHIEQKKVFGEIK